MRSRSSGGRDRSGAVRSMTSAAASSITAYWNFFFEPK